MRQEQQANQQQRYLVGSQELNQVPNQPQSLPQGKQPHSIKKLLAGIMKFALMFLILSAMWNFPSEKTIILPKGGEDFQQWSTTRYSDRTFLKPNPISSDQCQPNSMFQYPACNNDLNWQFYAIPNFFLDIYNIYAGNLTRESVQRARDYFKLGVNDPNQKNISDQKAYYENRYPDFFKYKQELHFCIFMVSYKNSKYDRYIWSLKSVLQQKYDNYHIVYVDDVSNDGTGYLAQQYIMKNFKNPERHKIVVNNYRRLSLQNMYIYANQYCGEHDIIFSSPDGDDALPGVFTLQLYNYYFQKYDMWVGWSGALFLSHGNIWTQGQLPKEALQPGKLKQYHNMLIPPPRVFYAKLWKMIKVSKMMDSDGTFYKSSQDHIEMLSVTQLGKYHAKHIPEITYLYHDDHGLNDRYVFDDSERLERINHILTHPQQEPLQCLFPKGQSCPKASEYVLQAIKKADQGKQKNQIQKPSQNLEQYPNKIKKVQKISNQQLKGKPFSPESYQLALEYRQLGLKQPNAELIKKQRDFYQTRYNISQTTLEFPFCVFITGSQNLNNDAYKLPLNAIFRQQYRNYHIVYVDDFSNDGTGQKVKQYIEKHAPFPEKHRVVFGRMKRNATYNHFIYAKEFCQPLDIQIIIGQSDSLVGTQVFRLYNHLFQQSNTWAIFGLYLNVQTGKIGQIIETQQNVKELQTLSSLKNYEVHPLAFYTQLWLNVKPKDLLNEQGWFYWNQTSLSVSKRILEQAKFWSYFPQILYLKVDDKGSKPDAKNRQRIMSTPARQRDCLTLPPLKIGKNQPKSYIKIKQDFVKQNCEEPRLKLNRLLLQQNKLQINANL